LNAACVLSTCPAMEMGGFGLCALVGNDPVMATQVMQGFHVTPPPPAQSHPLPREPHR
jgi:hypothetical protein